MAEIKNLIRSLCIPGTLKGCILLTDSVKIGVEDENTLLCVSKNIFSLVASKHNTTINCVEKNIRTAIDICWNGDGREKLFAVCGRVLSSRPTVTEMLDILVSYCVENGYKN